MTSATHPTLAGHRAWRRIIPLVLVIAMVLLGIAVAQRREQADINRPGVVDTAGALTAQEQLSVYARAHGLSGLSPASLTRPPVRTSGTAHEVGSSAVASGVYETYADVARYARARNLAGLSPAGLVPADSSASR